MRLSIRKTFYLLTLVVGYPVWSHAQDTIAIPDSVPVVVTDSVENQEQSSDRLQDLVDYNGKDSVSFDPLTNRAYLYNEAYINYQTTNLKAGFIIIDWNSNIVTAAGIRDSTGKITQIPIFTDNGKSYRSDTIKYNFNTKKGVISTVTTKEGEGYVHGEKVKMADDKTFYIQGTSFTTCNRINPDFEIVTNKAKMIIGDKIVTGPASLHLMHIPTPIVLPFGFFPMADKRSSGFIIPNYSDRQDWGFGLTNGGYYWAINDYMDLKVTGDIYTRGSFALRTESAYKVIYKYNGNVALNYSRIRYGDPRYVDAGNFQDRRDFSIRWTHNQDAKARPDLRFSANVNMATSSYFQNNTTNAGDYLTNTLSSSISLNKTWQGTPFSMTATAKQSQNSQNNTMTISLPDVNFSMQRIQPFRRENAVGEARWYENIGLTYQSNFKNDYSGSLDDLRNPSVIFSGNGLNYGMQHQVAASTNEKFLRYFTFNPSVNFMERWYPERLNYTWNQDSNRVDVDTITGFNAIHTYSVNAQVTTTLYGLFNFKGKVKAIRHVMYPQIGFNYTPDFADGFYGYYQTVQVDSNGTTALRSRYNGSGFIYGGPGAGRNGAVTFRLRNVVEGKYRSTEDSTGERKFGIFDDLTLNTSYNIAAETFKWAPVSVRASSSYFKGKLTFSYQGTFDMYGLDSLGVRVNESALKLNDKLVRNTSSQFSMGLRLKGKVKHGELKKADNTTALGLEEDAPNYYSLFDYMAIDAPWTANIDYTYRIDQPSLTQNITQTVTVSGSFEPTTNWRMGVSTGYDIANKGISYTTVDLKRNLHCWEFNIRWVPFGYARSYTIGLGIKANMFKDVKYEQRRGIGDF